MIDNLLIRTTWRKKLSATGISASNLVGYMIILFTL